MGKTRQSSHDQTWARCFPTGGDLLLLCPVSGHPIVQISWTRGTQSHHQSIHITNITRGTQSAHSVNKLAGRYRLCIVWMSNWVSLKIANEYFLVDYQKQINQSHQQSKHISKFRILTTDQFTYPLKNTLTNYMEWIGRELVNCPTQESLSLSIGSLHWLSRFPHPDL